MFCKNCGTKLEDSAKFCVQCGTKTEAPPPAEIKTIPVCGKCKTPLKEGDMFCASCGTSADEAIRVPAPPDEPVPPPAEIKTIPVCGKCKTPLKEGAMFCASCGTSADEAIRVPAPADEPAPATVPPPQIATNPTANAASGAKGPPITKGVKVSCEYDGALIQVVVTMFKRFLYIDGTLVDQHELGFVEGATYGGIATWAKKAILRAYNYPFKSGEKTVEVFHRSVVVTDEYMVCVNGAYAGGKHL